jgi:hypothetical protein
MFKKYMHVERLGTDEVEGLLLGPVVVQPKIDGANGSIWCEWDAWLGTIKCATRNQEVTNDNEAMGLRDWLKSNDTTVTLMKLFNTKGHWRLYGEWLVAHSLKTYRADAWRKFYVFDVLDDDTEKFVPYDEYQPVLADCGLDYIPILALVDNPTIEVLQGLVERNTYLIEDGKGAGEGLVVKRYDFVNQYGRTVWGKIVRNEFKEKNLVAFGPVKLDGGTTDEIDFAQQYVTRARVEKAKLELEPWQSQKIPGLFGIVYHDLIAEELWDFLKTHKNKVTLDFKILQNRVTQQVKLVYPELF